MALGFDPLTIVIVSICVGSIAMLLRRRRAPNLAMLDEALARVRAGESSVRVQPGKWGREAQLINRFNAALAEIEAGAHEWHHEPHAQDAVFDTLRKHESAVLTGGTFVAVVEIDRFSALRRSIGYRLANELLEKLAERIRLTVLTAEIGRIGRTTIEFAFRAPSKREAQLKLLSAIEALEHRLTIDEFSFDLTVSIGFADAGANSIRDELVDQAAAALIVGQAERVKVCFADAALLSGDGRADLDLMRALPEALAAGELELHYQPKLEARTNTISGAEALVRWHRPEGGLVPTEDFVRLAEETGAIRDLTEWVLARAVRDQATLAEAGHDIAIFVNISGMLLPDPDFARVALDLIRPARGRIGFEITETAVIGDPEAALANLRAFAENDVKIAIDDYGSGLSSLAYLKQLPANELKIDRLFVSGLTDSHRDPLIVRSSIDLAHALEMEVTAEGVDDAMSLSLLRVMGCDLLQGFYISPPLPLAKFIVFLNDDTQLVRLTSSSAAADRDWSRLGAA